MNKELDQQRFFAIVPAAGAGQRMQAEMPKQYLPLLTKTVLEHTVEKLLNEKKLQRIVVAVSPSDTVWRTIATLKNKRIDIVEGGESRCHSVTNAMHYLSSYCTDNDWVLVHDVARPCIAQHDLQQLMHQLSDDRVGGILAVPVSDTIKKVDEALNITNTLDRSTLWHAQTPQMFRYKLLLNALESALAKKCNVTDEASAIEFAGFTPKIVSGCRSNIKITFPEDLPLAEFYLRRGG